MSRRGENIHKRKDGRWEGRYPKGRDFSGKILYVSVYGKTYRETKEKLAACSVAEENKKPPKHSEPTFGEVLTLWFDGNKIRLKGATVTKYQSLIDTHILPGLGSLRISKISSSVINAFLHEKLEKGRSDKGGGLSPSYVRGMIHIVNSAVNYAVRERLCPPLRTPIIKPNVPLKELSILNPEQQKNLEEILTKQINPTTIGILLSLYTGMRIGEICALTWENIDFETKIIHVRHTIARVGTEGNKTRTKLIVDTPKTRASKRDIPISSRLLPYLKKAKKAANSPYVASETATFVSPRTYEYRYHRIFSLCGVHSVNYHALRHTFATRCIEAGVDVKSLSEILGHANVAITLNTYVHSSMDLKRAQIEKMTLFCG